jgi:hypothetical protein
LSGARSSCAANRAIPPADDPNVPPENAMSAIRYIEAVFASDCSAALADSVSQLTKVPTHARK